MKIIRMEWQNFRGLADGEILCNGRNVIVGGRNGVGKSSIASILPFVLFGKIPSKSFDERGITVSEQIPSATIEFDRITLRRVVTAGNKNRTFVNGNEVPAQHFNAAVWNLTNGAGTLLFNPFEFPEMHWKEQRDFLLKQFADDVKLVTAGDFKAELSRLKKDAAGVPYQISEIQSQLAELPTDDVSELDKRIEELQTELTRLQARQMSGDDSAKRLFEELQRREKNIKLALQYATARRDELRKRYHAVKSTCPTCGQEMPKEAVKKARDDIVTHGRQAAQNVAEAQAELVRIRAELAEVEGKIVEPTVDAAQVERIQALRKELSDLQSRRASLKSADNLRGRLARLTESEKTLNAQITELEGKIAHTEEVQRQQMAASESRVNRQFEFVKFKLFKVLTNGEFRETCEAMINGVPYSSLSKGEKFKAALDILRTFQRQFKTEMPLFVDDAESYTPNSLVNLPNQLFLFRVADTDLKILVNG